MKRVILVLAVVMSAMSVFAQDGSPKKNAQQRAEQFVKELTTELSLTADQSSKIKAVQLESLAKLDSIKAKATDGDKKAGKKEAKAVNEAASESIKAILTDEQKPKFDAWAEARKEKMKNKNGGKDKEKKEDKEN
jgi:Spy/CpxP family protein refolding chaperone